MVGMMRAHMADPHIVRKLEAGEADRIRPCVGASYCINRLYLGLEALCLHNPATGREETIPHARDPRRPGRRDGSSWWVAGRPASRRRGSPPNAVTPSSLLEAAPGTRAARSAWRPGRPPGASDLIGITDWLAVGVPAPRRGAPARARSSEADEVLALTPGRRHRGDGRLAADAGPRRGRRPGRQHLGHHRRVRHAVDRRRPRVRRPRDGGGPVVRRAAGRRRLARASSSRRIATSGTR